MMTLKGCITNRRQDEGDTRVCVDCGRQGCCGQCRIREEVWRKREINAGLAVDKDEGDDEAH